MATKLIKTIDTVLIAGQLLVLLMILGYVTPLAIFPLEDAHEMTASTVLLSLDPHATLAIGTTPDATAAKLYRLRDAETITLEPDFYYMFITTGAIEQIITLEVKDQVTLAIVETASGFDLVNAGARSLNLELRDRSSVLEERSVKTTKGGLFS